MRRAREVLRLAVLASALAVAGPALAADGPPPLELGKLLAELRARNPSVEAAARRVEAARLAVRRARALPDPEVSAMLEDLALEGAAMPMVRFSVSEMLPFPGKLGRMARAADRMADAAAARGETVALDLLATGRRLYYGLYLSGESRKVNREERAIVASLVDLATGRLAAGMSMHHDVLKMRTEASMLDSDLAMIDADRREMSAMLNALCDRPADAAVGEPVAAWSAARAWDGAALAAQARERRPELREMASMASGEHAMADAARREYLPDFMVGAIYDLRAGGPDAVGAMVGLSVPLWIPWKQRLDVKAAEARAAAVERDRDAMAAMVGAEVESALARVASAEARLVRLEGELLPLARETFDAGVAAYGTGATNALDVLDALRAVTNARLAATALRVEREIAIVDLARAVGVSPEELR